MNSEFRFALKQKTLYPMPLGVRVVACANLLAAAFFLWSLIFDWAAPVKSRFETFHGFLVFLYGAAGTLFLAVVMCLLLKKILVAAILERAAVFVLAAHILAEIALGAVVENEGVFGFVLMLFLLFFALFAAIFYRCAVYLRQVGHAD